MKIRKAQKYKIQKNKKLDFFGEKIASYEKPGLKRTAKEADDYIKGFLKKYSFSHKDMIKRRGEPMLDSSNYKEFLYGKYSRFNRLYGEK